MSHFPEVDRIEAVAQAWPRLFAEPPVGLQPLTLDETTLIVLCQAPNLIGFIEDRPIPTEIYLARELLSLKRWLRDVDIGF